MVRMYPERKDYRDDQITSGSERFEALANPATGQLVITHYFLDDRRAWFGSAPKDVKVISIFKTDC